MEKYTRKIPKGPFLEFEKPFVEFCQKVQSLTKQDDIASEEIEKLMSKKLKQYKKVYEKMTPWDRVELSRRTGRPYTQDFIKKMFTDFVELKGDRLFGEDSALVSGIAKLNNQSVVVVGHQKGKSTKESIEYNFGMAHPEGYRKALRIFRLGERFGLPIISFIDTPGAYPGLGAEERGQAEAIARNILEMTKIKVPIICIVIGEGASGGALGIGISDRFLMLENTWYSVISPEGCATILWGDASKKREVSEIMKLTAGDLKVASIVDRIVPEPLGGAHWDNDETIKITKEIVLEELFVLQKLTLDELLEQRLEKYTVIGN